MKSHLFTTLLTFALMTPAFMAPALAVAKPKPVPAVPKPNPLTCSLDFNVSGVDIQVGLGYSKLKGRGKITCLDAKAVKSSLPIKVSIGTPAIFPRISFSPHVKIHGVAEKIQVSKGGAKAILGKYSTADLQIAVGSGAGAILDLQGEANNMIIKLQLENVEGFGIAVGGTFVTLSL